MTSHEPGPDQRLIGPSARQRRRIRQPHHFVPPEGQGPGMRIAVPASLKVADIVAERNGGHRDVAGRRGVELAPLPQQSEQAQHVDDQQVDRDVQARTLSAMAQFDPEQRPACRVENLVRHAVAQRRQRGLATVIRGPPIVDRDAGRRNLGLDPLSGVGGKHRAQHVMRLDEPVPGALQPFAIEPSRGYELPVDVAAGSAERHCRAATDEIGQLQVGQPEWKRAVGGIGLDPLGRFSRSGRRQHGANRPPRQQVAEADRQPRLARQAVADLDRQDRIDAQVEQHRVGFQRDVERQNPSNHGERIALAAWLHNRYARQRDRRSVGQRHIRAVRRTDSRALGQRDIRAALRRASYVPHRRGRLAAYRLAWRRWVRAVGGRGRGDMRRNGPRDPVDERISVWPRGLLDECRPHGRVGQPCDDPRRPRHRVPGLHHASIAEISTHHSRHRRARTGAPDAPIRTLPAGGDGTVDSPDQGRRIRGGEGGTPGRRRPRRAEHGGNIGE